MMKIKEIFIIILSIFIFCSCQPSEGIGENFDKQTTLKVEDDPLIAEYKAILFEGKPIEESFLKNVKFYDQEGNLISKDIATATLRDPEEPILFSYEQELTVTEFCCQNELIVEDAIPNEVWFVSQRIDEHEAIQNPDVLYFFSWTFEHLTQAVATVSYVYNSFTGVPCGSSTVTFQVLAFNPGAFPSGKHKVTAEIGFWKHNPPEPGINTGLRNFMEVCSKDSKQVIYE